MAKKAAHKSAAAGADERGFFSTLEIRDAIDKVLGQLRDARKEDVWTIPQHLQATACEVALVLARKKCLCTSSSMSFPKPGLSQKAALRLLKEPEQPSSRSRRRGSRERQRPSSTR